MTEIARKLGVELPKPIVDGFGQITMASQQAAQAIDLSWLANPGRPGAGQRGHAGADLLRPKG